MMTKYALIQRYLVFFLAIAALALALHSPGEISVDSGRQLHEAAIGRSLSWNPPFMSAWLHVLGRGMVASALFIFINALVTYFSFATVLGCLTFERRLPLWRISISVIAFINPIFFYYVGIVWKDVLIGTALVAIATSLIAATLSQGRWRHGLLIIVIILAAILPLMRQQGILVSPIFVVIGAYLFACDFHPKKLIKLALLGVLVISSLGVYSAAKLWTRVTIADSADRDFSNGLNLIMVYDISGVIANTSIDETKDIPVDAAVASRLRHDYSAERVDPIMADRGVTEYLDGMSTIELRKIWLRSIESHPGAYIDHKVEAFSWLLGMHDVELCVPAYFGKYTLKNDAIAAGGQESYDNRARLLKRGEEFLRSTPVFRNWFYVLLLMVSTVALVLGGWGERKLVSLGILGSAWIYLLSFVPTSIACDVRYLYPVAVLSTIGFVAVLLNYGSPTTLSTDGSRRNELNN